MELGQEGLVLCCVGGGGEVQSESVLEVWSFGTDQQYSSFHSFSGRQVLKTLWGAKWVYLGVARGAFSIRLVITDGGLLSTLKGLSSSGVVARSFSFTIGRATLVDYFISSASPAFMYISACSRASVKVQGGSAPNYQESSDGWSLNLRVERVILGSSFGISVVVVLNR